MKAMFGAGCFWGVQYYFDQIPGVISTQAGYSGGQTKNPTYEQVCTGSTGHAEVVLVEFNKKQVSYRTLAKHFFRMHDSSQIDRQGSDVGSQYRSVIYFFDQEQAKTANDVKATIQKTIQKPIVTEILPANDFYLAEEYHQKFAQKTGKGVCHIPYSPLS
jgi:peptide-methionine (S)-S-oxide reductase